MAHRFFVPKNEIADEFSLTGENGLHAAKVLRLEPGEEIIICDGEGADYHCIVTGTDKRTVNCRVTKKIANSAEPHFEITLFQCLPKSDKMEYIIQKSVELGVYRIVPVYSSRCIAKPDLSGGKTERFNKISEAAAKQSQRGIIPCVTETLSLKSAAEQVKSKFNIEFTIVAFEAEKSFGLKEFLRDISFQAGKDKPENKCSIGIFIGPEGGFSDDEIEVLREKGIFAVSLGRRILRTETAGTLAVGIISYELENNETR